MKEQTMSEYTNVGW